MNSLPSDIKISILLAIILMMVVVLFLIFVVVLYSRKQILNEKEIKLQELTYGNQLLQKELEYQKLAQKEHERISNDLHDDLGAGISAIRLQAEFLKSSTTNPDKVANIEDLLQTCNSLNRSMREMMWSLNSETDSLQNFVEHIVNYTKNFVNKTAIKFSFTQLKIDHQQVSAEQRRNLFLCVKEAINNVYKHSGCENVELHFTQKGTHFIIDVIDDGSGMSDEVQHGNGLENMKSRMSSLCGNFSVVPTEKGLHIQLSLDLEGNQ